MADLISSTTSQSAIANTEDEEKQKSPLEVRFDELMRKFEKLSQKVQLNEKRKMADEKEQAPLLDYRVDGLMTKFEDFTRKIQDNEKDECGDEEDQKVLSDPHLNKMLKKIDDLNLKFKEKEDLSRKRERELVKKVEDLIKGKETQGKIISEQKLNDLNRSFQINETEKKTPDVRVDELMKKVEELQKEKENQNKTISDLQEQFASHLRNSPNESFKGVNSIRNNENLDVLQLQMSDPTEGVQHWDENEIRLVYDIASILTFLFRLLFAVSSYFIMNNGIDVTGTVILALSVVFEMMTTTFEEKIMKMATSANFIGWALLAFNNGQPFFYTQNVVGATPSYQAMVAISAILIGVGQVVIVNGVIKHQKSLLLKAAYVVNACPFFVYIYYRCVAAPKELSEILVLPGLFLHAVFLFFGLPASKSYGDTFNQNPSNILDDSALRNTMETNEPLTLANVYHHDQSRLYKSEKVNANDIINGNDYQLQQQNNMLRQDTSTTFPTDHNVPSSYRQHRSSRLSILYGVNKGSNIKGELERDMYTMMMLSHWKQISYRIPKWCCCSWCRKKYYVVYVPLPSKSWIMGVLVFSVQFALGVLIIYDQVTCPPRGTTMNIPPHVGIEVRIGQLMTVLLSLFSQTDVTITLYNLCQLWYGPKSQWNKVIGKEHDTSLKLWLGRIFVPNALKISQGFTILIASYILIIQSDDIVILLKDFTALFVISSADDIFFIMADHGYFGVDLSEKSDKLKAIETREDDKKIWRRLQFILFAMILALLGGWIYVVDGQMNGRYYEEMYPYCRINQKMKVIDDNRHTFVFRKNKKQMKYSFYMKNDVCDFPKGEGPNSEDCGWEAGDCVALNKKFLKYPSCPAFNIIFDPSGENRKMKYFSYIDNAICDFAKGVGPNSEECGWEGGDCLVFNEQYPFCAESDIRLIHNGKCDSETNIEECGFDGNDCLEENEQLKSDYPDCSVRYPSWIGDGICDGVDYNTTECGWDGGDCLVLQKGISLCKGKKANTRHTMCVGINWMMP